MGQIDKSWQSEIMRALGLQNVTKCDENAPLLVQCRVEISCRAEFVCWKWYGKPYFEIFQIDNSQTKSLVQLENLTMFPWKILLVNCLDYTV